MTNEMQTVFENILDSANSEYFETNRTPAGVCLFAEGAHGFMISDDQAALISETIDKLQIRFEKHGEYSAAWDECLTDLE